jgi:hypothetical protein
MGWIRIDERIHSHPAVQAAGLEAIGLWILAVAHSAAHATNGFVREETITRLCGDEMRGAELASSLLTAGLLGRHDGGYCLNCDQTDLIEVT